MLADGRGNEENCQYSASIIEEIMITEIDINKHNFSKIGKYISNKLHHIHKPIAAKQASQPKTDRHPSKNTEEPKHNKLSKKDPPPKRDREDFSPPVGTYRVNYAIVDKYPSCNLETSTSTTSTGRLRTSLVKSTRPTKSRPI